MAPIPFQQVARLAAANDNVAIATRRIEAGSTLTLSADETGIGKAMLQSARLIKAAGD